MYEVLQHRELFYAVGAPLGRHFVADRPHDHGRRIAEMLHHIGDVFPGPFAEEPTVAVFLAKLDEFGRGHVVAGSDGVHAHIFQQFDLMAQGGAVDGGSERPEIVMVAHSFELCFLSVEEETFVPVFDSPDTETCVVGIGLTTIDRKGSHGGVEAGMIKVPELRMA